MQDFVTEEHLARFIVALVCEQLDLAEIDVRFTSPLGPPPFDPRLMVALPLYAYCSGIYSSRRIAKACRELEPRYVFGIARRLHTCDTHANTIWATVIIVS